MTTTEATEASSARDSERRAPLVIAHRGGAGEAPENTLAAFESAIAQCADMVELDVRRTADSRLVVHHAPRRAGRPLAALTYADLVARSRHRPPLLEEALELCAGRIGVDVELKEPGYEARALAIVDRHLRPSPWLVTSFLHAVVAAAKRLRPDIAAGLLLGWGRLRTSHAGRDRAVLEPALACGADFIATHQLLLGLHPGSRRRRRRTTPLPAQAREAGLGVAVWTVNGDAHLRRCLANSELAAVITDLPAVAVGLRGGAPGWQKPEVHNCVTGLLRLPLPEQVRPELP